MAHYAMLNEYHFSADVDDIRGATLYSADDKKVGKVVDVIFNHDTGEVSYLVVKIGLGHKVLVPANHVYRAVVDEDEFETDMTAAEVERLPKFDEKMLETEKQWREHEHEHRRAWKEQEERLLAEYKQKWHEGPVLHRHGSDRNITPDEEPGMGSSGATGEPNVTAADLWPHRIAGKFPGVGQPMVAPSNPEARETTLQPVPEEKIEDKPVIGMMPPSPRWHGFEDSIQKNLGEIRMSCTACCPTGESRVA
jgi:hypothetical protein